MANTAIITLAILGGGLAATGAVVAIAHSSERRQCMAAHAGDPQASNICSTGSGRSGGSSGGGWHGNRSTASNATRSSPGESTGSVRGGFGGAGHGGGE